VLDDWNYLSPQLQDLYETLNNGRARHAFPFDASLCMAPLPRAYQCAVATAYPQHAELLCKANGAEVPESLKSEPAITRVAGDAFLGACDAIKVPSVEPGIDFGAGLAVVTGDVPQGSPADKALDGVRLLMLASEVHWRALQPSAVATAFGPVAVTPDELGEAWSRGRVQLTLQTTWNGRKVGMGEAGADMHFHFGQLIAHLCKTRNVRAGSIVVAGPVSNKGIEKKGRTDWPAGYHCIAEKRAMESVQDGQAATGYLQFGDTVRSEMKGRDGQSVFGAIEQEVVSTDPDRSSGAE
jgi:fumarylacetoacetate (FAA) hydrolase